VTHDSPELNDLAGKGYVTAASARMLYRTRGAS